MEEWRDIPGQVGRYQVSSEGRIRSHRSLWWKRAAYRTKYDERGQATKEEWRERKQTTTPLGYKMVLLSPGSSGEKRGYGVHRLVAAAFLSRPLQGGEKWEVNHKNFVRDDNRVENLEWITLAENRRRRRPGIHPFTGKAPIEILRFRFKASHKNGRSYKSQRGHRSWISSGTAEGLDGG